LIATAVAVPVALIVGLALGNAVDQPDTAPSSGVAVLPPVTVTPPPNPGSATTSTCAQVISALPLVLDGKNLRRTVSTPPTGLVQAWGDPPIVMRCGVAKPPELNPSNTTGYLQLNGVLTLVTSQGDNQVYTVVDRSVFIELDVPHEYASAPVPPVMNAIRKVLPNPVCVNEDPAHPQHQCTRR
jgi:hypothetical protein